MIRTTFPANFGEDNLVKLRRRAWLAWHEESVQGYKYFDRARNTTGTAWSSELVKDPHRMVDIVNAWSLSRVFWSKGLSKATNASIPLDGVRGATISPSLITTQINRIRRYRGLYIIVLPSIKRFERSSKPNSRGPNCLDHIFLTSLKYFQPNINFSFMPSPAQLQVPNSRKGLKEN